MAISKEELKECSDHLYAFCDFMNDRGNYAKINEKLLIPLEQELSSNRKFYDTVDQRKNIFANAIANLTGKTTNNEVCEKLIQAYFNSALGIFGEVLSKEISDVFIVSDRISFSSNNYEEAQDIVIPDEYINSYSFFVDLFIRLTLYASNAQTTKFDKAEAILDYTCEELRFNVVHESLNASRFERPIIAIRKQLIRASGETGLDILDDNYIKSLDVSPAQLEFINQLAADGSYVVFGETGSGKTTLLKYMGNYKINEKRNLITIEDTPELFLPVNIAYLTNDRHNIQQLFRITLRENPSHVIVGETRSSEIVDILESALVFRCGTSLHADSLEKLIIRIVYMAKGSEAKYNTHDIYSLITSTMDGFVHMKNRKVVGVYKRKDNITDLEDALNAYEEIV